MYFIISGAGSALGKARPKYGCVLIHSGYVDQCFVSFSVNQLVDLDEFGRLHPTASRSDRIYPTLRTPFVSPSNNNCSN